MGSTPHAFRFQRDVLAKGTPDLLFIEAAVKDRGSGFSEKAQIRALNGFALDSSWKVVYFLVNE